MIDPFDPILVKLLGECASDRRNMNPRRITADWISDHAETGIEEGLAQVMRRGADEYHSPVANRLYENWESSQLQLCASSWSRIWFGEIVPLCHTLYLSQGQIGSTCFTCGYGMPWGMRCSMRTWMKKGPLWASRLPLRYVMLDHEGRRLQATPHGGGYAWWRGYFPSRDNNVAVVQLLTPTTTQPEGNRQYCFEIDHRLFDHMANKRNHLVQNLWRRYVLYDTVHAADRALSEAALSWARWTAARKGMYQRRDKTHRRYGRL